MIIIGLGANLDGLSGSPEQTMRKAAQRFHAYGLNIVSSSHIWESAPVPISNQPWYKNAVCAVQTELTPHNVLVALNKIEEEFGRIRSYKNAPRVLDLDLIAYHDLHITDNALTLPHPHMHLRAFVLYPLREIAPTWRHPLLDKNVDNLIATLPTEQEIRQSLGDKLYPVTVKNNNKLSA